MAVPVREKNIAMSVATRVTPTLSSNVPSNARGSVGASSGSRANTSAKSRRVIGGQTGTAAQMHPMIGTRSSASPLPAKVSSFTKSTIRNNDDTKIKDSSMSIIPPEELSIYPSLPPSTSYDERPIGGKIISGTSHHQTVSNTFEAQMERALASGANPFQDRRRDQMRDESAVSFAEDPNEMLEQPNASVSRKYDSPLRPTAVSHSILSPKICTKARNGHLESPRSTLLPRAVTPSSPLEPLLMRRSPAKTADTSSLTTTNTEVLELRSRIKEEAMKLEDSKKEREKVVKELREKERSNEVQKEQIKDLQEKVAKWKAKAKETGVDQIISVAHAWEMARVKCREAMSREVLRERDVEAIISRNEVSYMDARRAEGELDLELCRLELEHFKSFWNESERRNTVLEEDLMMTKKSAKESEGRILAMNSNENMLKEALQKERDTILTFEEDLREASKEVSVF